jgi:voltage-gated potassium channel
MKQKIHHLLNENRYVTQFIYGLIVVNVIAIVLDSYYVFHLEHQHLFHTLEVVSVILFTLEYFLRIWTADKEYKHTPSSFKSRLKFIFSSYGIIDLLAISPFYLPFFFAFDLRIIRILRLIRLLRILKLGRYSHSLKMVSSVLRETRAQLTVTLFVAVILLVLSSSIMFYLEHDVQPDKFQSIGHTLWWSVSTLTSVGYGDVFPVTPWGKLLSGIIAIIGIGFVALPTGIISSAFVQRLKEHHEKTPKKTCTCPHCGETFESEK